MLGKIIGILGSLGIGASLLLKWSSLVFKKFGESSEKQVGGIELLQGQIAAGLAFVALVLLFVKPKLAIIPALGAIGMAGWYYVDIMDTPYKPGIGLWVVMGCGVLVALASFMIKPKNKA